jgi:hypothetical protein
MVRLLRICAILLLLLNPVLFASDGEPLRSQGKQVQEGGILLPRETSYQAKGFGVGIGSGALFPSGKKCKALALWQGTLEYYYARYVSAGISVRMYGGNIDDENFMLYQRYHSHFRLHYLANPRWSLYLEPSLGFESTSLETIRGKDSDQEPVEEVESLDPPDGCQNEYTLDGFSTGLALGSGYALSESWAVNGAAGYEHNWAGVGQLTLTAGIGFNLRNNVNYLKRNVLGTWIALEVASHRYFFNETGEWGFAVMLAFILNI